jgi:hypothetical protein
MNLDNAHIIECTDGKAVFRHIPGTYIGQCLCNGPFWECVPISKIQEGDEILMNNEDEDTISGISCKLKWSVI